MDLNTEANLISALAWIKQALAEGDTVGHERLGAIIKCAAADIIKAMVAHGKVKP